MIKKIKCDLNTFGMISKKHDSLYCLGNTDLLLNKKISIVGSRRPSLYAQTYTHKISNELSKRGITIVSGAAMGVDAIAHKATVNYNTIAVVANGLNIHYPSVNKKLIQEIENKGLMLSQFEENEKARNYTFVQRNEVVVCLGDALIITHADLNSGSLRSAEFAIKHNKPIFVLPHRLDESLGTQHLIQEGKATPIYDIESFANRFGEIHNHKECKKDDFLTYCKKHSNYEQVFAHNEEKLLEYEIEGKIRINNGIITVV